MGGNKLTMMSQLADSFILSLPRSVIKES